VRNLVQFPLTVDEIAQACELYARVADRDLGVGNTHAPSLIAAAAIVRHASALLQEMDQRLDSPRDVTRFGAPFGAASKLMTCTDWDWGKR
jgi:hypothetical protein